MGQLTLYDWMQEGQSIHSVPPAFLTVSFIVSIHRDYFPDRISMPHRTGIVKSICGYLTFSIIELYKLNYMCYTVYAKVKETAERFPKGIMCRPL